MKAFLLAAGVGSRLKPITDTMPKCMLPIGGRPLLDIWLDALWNAGVDNVLLNVHHLPDVIYAYLQGRARPPVVQVYFEQELLGSAGTLAANRDWVGGEEAFLVCYADNLTDFELRNLIDAHRRYAAAATLAVFPTDRPSSCGIVEVDHEGTVISFQEKPSDPRGDLANAGMYVFHPSVLEEIGECRPMDIGFDLLPRLVGRARVVPVTGFFRDIGTPAAYHRAQQEWTPIPRMMQ